MARLPRSAFATSERRRGRAAGSTSGSVRWLRAALDADGFRTAPSPPDRPGEEMDQSAAENEADDAGDETLGRGRNGRLVGLVGARGDLRIEILGEHEDAPDRAGFGEVFGLLFEALAPHDRVAHLIAALLDETVVRLLQMRDSLLLVHSRLGCLGLEALDQSVELIDRAAEPLAVLLRVFRHLRGNDAEKQADQRSDAAEKHGNLCGLGGITAAGIGRFIPAARPGPPHRKRCRTEAAYP